MPACSRPAFARMDQRVELQERVAVPDGQGGAAETWEARVTVWAAVEPVTGHERYLAQRTDAQPTHRVTLRHRGDVTPALRLLWAGRVMDVTEVIDEGGRGHTLRLLCAEGGRQFPPAGWQHHPLPWEGLADPWAAADAYDALAAPWDGLGAGWDRTGGWRGGRAYEQIHPEWGNVTSNWEGIG